jgi:hypothetical protein
MMEGERGEMHLSGKSSGLLRRVALVVLILAGRRAELGLPAAQLGAAHNTV